MNNRSSYPQLLGYIFPLHLAHHLVQLSQLELLCQKTFQCLLLKMNVLPMQPDSGNLYPIANNLHHALLDL